MASKYTLARTNGTTHLMRNYTAETRFGPVEISESVCGSTQAQSHIKASSIRQRPVEGGEAVTCKRCLRWMERYSFQWDAEE